MRSSVERLGSVKVAGRGGLQAWRETVEQYFECRGDRDVEEQEIQQLQKQEKTSKENSLNKLNAFQSTIKHLSSSNYSMYNKFRDAFQRLFEADERTFKFVLSRNMQNVERQLHKETLQASNASSGDKDCSRIVSDKGNDQGLDNQSNTSRDESSRSRNECNDKSTSRDDTDIRPSFDTEPMVENDLNVVKSDDEHLKAQLQDKNISITKLKKIIEKMKGKSVDTKFEKPSILGKPPLQPIRNKPVVRQPTKYKSKRSQLQRHWFASQVGVSHDLTKPVTPHSWPQLRKSSFAKPYDVNAPRPSRKSPKHVSFQTPRESIGSNGMVYNYYLEEAKKKTQL
uniref:Uncharacterized protein n=1 Tax=Tanacetum cinerariifolium TaxID=118510 RepID=A0A6L2LDV0_TANCI|nr:hypothetical protein [Tanacetum cinerariifolium]